MSDFDLTYTQTGDLGNKIGGQKGAKGILSGELVVVPRNDPRAAALILNFEREVAVAAGQFIASQSFVKSNPKVKFGYLDERLKFFGDKENMLAGKLAAHTLLVSNYDPEIMVALGPQASRFIELGQFYQLIEGQGQGQEGPLLINGRANIAYILDDRGAPWALNAYWLPSYGAWDVDVHSVASLLGWGAGRRVFSQVA